MTIEITPGYTVEYIEAFYETQEAEDLLRSLLAVDMTPEIIRLYGKTHETKRRSAQYGADYDYNPTAKKSQAWTPLMLSIRGRMESVAGPLDGGLVQVYPTGEAGIGWHEDRGTRGQMRRGVEDAAGARLAAADPSQHERGVQAPRASDQKS